MLVFSQFFICAIQNQSIFNTKRIAVKIVLKKKEKCFEIRYFEKTQNIADVTYVNEVTLTGQKIPLKCC